MGESSGVDLAARFGAVAAGGVLGACLRFAIATAVADRWGVAFPYATFGINISGAFAIGFFFTFIASRLEIDPVWRYFVATGFLGGYTTFSSYAWEALVLARESAWLPLSLYVVGSNVLGLLGVWLGAVLARGFDAPSR